MKEKGKLLAFATNMNISPEMIRRLFRKRWSIETSYRMVRKFLAKTTLKTYSIRLLYFWQKNRCTDLFLRSVSSN